MVSVKHGIIHTANPGIVSVEKGLALNCQFREFEPSQSRPNAGHKGLRLAGNDKIRNCRASPSTLNKVKSVITDFRVQLPPAQNTRSVICGMNEGQTLYQKRPSKPDSWK